MAVARSKLIRKGEMLPSLGLVDADGTPSGPGPSNQASLLIIVHPERCDDCVSYLDELGKVVSDLQAWATSLTVVVPKGAAADPGKTRPFPVLGDADGKARSGLGLADDEAAVILSDRWGEVAEVATVGNEHDFPLPHQLVESAKIVDLSCGECNVPSAEWRGAT